MTCKIKIRKKCKHGLDFLEKEFQYFEKDLEMIKIPLSYMTICAQPLSNEFLTLPQAVDTEWNCKSFRHFWNKKKEKKILSEVQRSWVPSFTIVSIMTNVKARISLRSWPNIVLCVWEMNRRLNLRKTVNN